MRVRSEIGLAVGALLLVQVVASFAAIALLGRMSPAIAQILDENLYSVRAAEEMLATLALPPAEDAAQAASRAARFRAALERARSNVTESEEEPVLAAIDETYAAALAGEPAARRRTVDQVERLAEINHASILRADEGAQRLGLAGAWAAVFLGFTGFVLSAVAVARLTRVVVRPLQVLGEAVQAFRGGDPHRRCGRLRAPAELREVAAALDDLLDDYHAERRLAVGSEEASPGAAPSVERALLLHLLDGRPEPHVALDRRGGIVAVNEAALGLLDGTARGRRLRDDLSRLAAAEEPAPAPGLTWVDVGTAARLVSVDLPTWEEAAAEAPQA